MPTGYTAAIADGINFREFALNCARNFGALIHMRDEPADAKIPQNIEPSDYHLKKIKEIENALFRLRDMTPGDAEIEAEKEYNAGVISTKKSIQEKHELRAKYKDMLSQVKEYVPPTSDHVRFKEFMIEQIESSINFDCDVSYHKLPQRMRADVWLDTNEAKLLKDLEYHKKEHRAEELRCEDRTQWVQELFKSLPSEQ